MQEVMHYSLKCHLTAAMAAMQRLLLAPPVNLHHPGVSQPAASQYMPAGHSMPLSDLDTAFQQGMSLAPNTPTTFCQQPSWPSSIDTSSCTSPREANWYSSGGKPPLYSGGPSLSNSWVPSGASSPRQRMDSGSMYHSMRSHVPSPFTSRMGWQSGGPSTPDGPPGLSPAGPQAALSPKASQRPSPATSTPLAPTANPSQRSQNLSQMQGGAPSPKASLRQSPASSISPQQSNRSEVGARSEPARHPGMPDRDRPSQDESSRSRSSDDQASPFAAPHVQHAAHPQTAHAPQEPAGQAARGNHDPTLHQQASPFAASHVQPAAPSQTAHASQEPAGQPPMGGSDNASPFASADQQRAGQSQPANTPGNLSGQVESSSPNHASPFAASNLQHAAQSQTTRTGVPSAHGSLHQNLPAQAPADSTAPQMQSAQLTGAAPQQTPAGQPARSPIQQKFGSLQGLGSSSSGRLRLVSPFASAASQESSFDAPAGSSMPQNSTAEASPSNTDHHRLPQNSPFAAAATKEAAPDQSTGQLPQQSGSDDPIGRGLEAEQSSQPSPFASAIPQHTAPPSNKL